MLTRISRRGTGTATWGAVILCVGEMGARLNVLNHTIILQVVGKPPKMRCGKIIRLSCHTVQLRHLSGCDSAVVHFGGININSVAVTRKPAVFSGSIMRKLHIQC